MPATILSDNGVSSGTAGIKTTGSNDGQLALQTTTSGGAATTALTIDTSQNSTFAGTASATKLIPTGGTATGNGMYLPAANSVAFSTNGAEAMRIDSSGNVGIGDTAPGTKLSVKDTTALVDLTSTTGTNYVSYRLNNTGGQLYIAIDNSAGSNFNTGSAYAAAIWRSGSYPICFVNNSTERARITSTGNLLINTTSNVYSTARAILQISVSNAVNDTGLVIKHTDATGVAQVYAQRFLNASGTEVGSIKVTSSDTQYVTSSDRRLKENIAAADDAGEIIDAIEIIKYDWKSGGHVDYGVIAQDLHTVAPEVVSVGDNEEEIINTWGVDYSKLVPILIKEVQSLRQRIAAFEARLATLEIK